MSTICKIKIKDNKIFRKKIDKIYQKSSQINVSKWSILIAKRILTLADIDYNKIDIIKDGFDINEKWQNNLAKVKDIRKIGFEIHKYARSFNSDLIKLNALRTTGQAISSGHMKEHAMVSSDYAIKTINLLYPNDLKKIDIERETQLDDLCKLIDNDEINLKKKRKKDLKNENCKKQK